MVSLEFFIDIKPFRSHYGPGVDSASNRNEYQEEHFLGGKGGRCVRLTLPPSCAVVMKSWNLNFLEPSKPLQSCNGTACYGVDRAGEHIFPTPTPPIPHPAPYFVKQTSHRLQKCGVRHFGLAVSTLPFLNRTFIVQSFGVTHKLNFVEIG